MGVPACGELNLAFIQAEQQVTRNLVSTKWRATNHYYGKIPDGEPFPLGSGTHIKGRTLGKVFVPNEGGWRRVEDGLCETNACGVEPEVISHGNGDYEFDLVQRDLRTDWICIDSAALREMADKELMKLEEGLQNASRFVHEEFRRSRYYHYSANKLGALVSDTSGDLVLDCANDLIDNFYIFEEREGGEIDENYVRVKVNLATDSLDSIAELSLDMFDVATERLMYEDVEYNYLNGTRLYDALLADKRMANKLAIQEDTIMNNSASQGGYNMVELSQKYGTERVLRNYSLRCDSHAARFYPDDAFNASLPTFDEENPATWPRMRRVYPYRPGRSKVAGMEGIVNLDYLKAPFGISTILIPRVMDVMSFPNVVSVGGARKAGMAGGLGYEGTAQWINPDWECNLTRDKGFWLLRFRMAARPGYVDEGYTYFHKIDHRLRLAGNPCESPDVPCYDEVTPYCTGGIQGATVTGDNRVIDTRI